MSVLRGAESAARAREVARPVVRFDSVTRRRGDRVVLDAVTLDVHEGECVVVCGPSGSGKTTLLRAIAGLVRIDQGEISVDGRVRSSSAGADLLAGDVAMVFQGEQLYANLTLVQNVMLGPVRVLKRQEAAARTHALELLHAVGLGLLAERYPHELSGGERQRGAIVRALAMNPRLVLFDEPTSALDPSCIKEVLALIYELHMRGQTMILVTHETGFARMIADRIVCMDAGRIHEAGQPHQIVVAPKHCVTKRLFGDALQEISALDRVVYTEILHVGYFEEGDRERLEEAPFLRKLGESLASAVVLRKLKLGDAALQLRMGTADVIARPVAAPDSGDRIAKFPFECAGVRYSALVNELDSVWVRTVAALSDSRTGDTASLHLAARSRAPRLQGNR